MKELPTYSKTAVLLFVRSEEEELQHKCFVSGGDRLVNLKVLRALNHHTRALAQVNGLPVETISSESQRGETFGERFVHALQDAFAKGYESLIVIGNDCPSLRGSDIQTAFKTLQEEQVVLGPASDGGVYLIGIHRDTFDVHAWTKLPWQRKDLFSALQHWLKQKGTSIFLLPNREDADCPISFKKSLRGLNWTRQPRLFLFLKWALVGCGHLPAIDIPNVPIYHSTFSPCTIGYRGPPAV